MFSCHFSLRSRFLLRSATEVNFVALAYHKNSCLKKINQCNQCKQCNPQNKKIHPHHIHHNWRKIEIQKYTKFVLYYYLQLDTTTKTNKKTENAPCTPCTPCTACTGCTNHFQKKYTLWVGIENDCLLACRLLAGCCWVVHNESGYFAV